MTYDDAENWRPTATLEAIKIRASLYRRIRFFFELRKVLEVETPILGLGATIDPCIDSLIIDTVEESRYLQTSPEFFLKRLLAADSGDIYSLGKVFRRGEIGRRHQSEFTLLEWYRVGWDEQQLMTEVVELIQTLIPTVVVHKLSYQDLFLDHLGIDPHTTHVDELKSVARNFIDIANPNGLSTDDWLDLIMTHYLEAKLPDGLTLIYDYPQTKAVLAVLDKNSKGQTIARRFEAYLNAVELANGYFELTDAKEQRRRFEKDLEYRKAHNLPILPCDERFLAALEAGGLPACAGVALGVDRLLMVLCETQTIQEVIAFAYG